MNIINSWKKEYETRSSEVLLASLGFYLKILSGQIYSNMFKECDIISFIPNGNVASYMLHGIMDEPLGLESPVSLSLGLYLCGAEVIQE